MKWDKSAQESTSDPLLNQNRCLASIATKSWVDTKKTEDTPNCTCCEDGSSKLISGDDMLKILRQEAEEIGEDKFGFSPSDIVTHSVRSGATMAMFLDSMPIFLIILVRCWSSDAFFKHSRGKVLEAEKGASSHTLKRDFFNVMSSPSSSIDEPHTRSRDSFALILSSMALTSSQKQVMRPAFSLHH